MHSQAMRILGIDPGLSTIGIGLTEVARPGENPTVIEWLTIETKAGADMAVRLAEIAKDLREYIDDARPDLAIVERLFFQTNRRSAFDVAQARGVMLSVLGESDIRVIEPTPLELKHAITGDGKADKRQMQDMIMRTLKLDAVPTPDDAADALALSLYGASLSHRLNLVA